MNADITHFQVSDYLLLSVATTPQDHLPSSRVTTAGGEAGVSSITADCEANNGAAIAELAEIGDIVSNSSTLASVTAAAPLVAAASVAAAAALVAAASVAAAALVAAAAASVTAFGWSPTRPQTQAPPGKTVGYSGFA